MSVISYFLRDLSFIIEHSILHITFGELSYLPFLLLVVVIVDIYLKECCSQLQCWCRSLNLNSISTSEKGYDT